MDIARVIRRLDKAENTYQSVIGKEEAKIADKVEFDFSIQYQPSDGFTIVSEDGSVASLVNCLDIIKRQGVLTYNDFLKVLL